MADQLSARDWLDHGLKTLVRNGFTALKAEPLAKAMGVSRGSFYWHFRDIDAYHAAILRHWGEVAAEQVIADVDASSPGQNPMLILLRRAFGSTPTLERAVRTWATVDPLARKAVEAIDRRRIAYMESLLAAGSLTPAAARARVQILYWAFLGFAMSDAPLPPAKQAAILDELIRVASP